MKLDSRGVMDGAMKGFALMDNYYANQDAKTERKEAKEENTRRYEEGLRRADEQLKREQDWREESVARDEKWKEKTWERDEARYKTERTDARRREARASRLQQAQIDLSQYRLEREKKAQFIQDNTLALDHEWKVYGETGDHGELLDNPYIKGSFLDPRTYTPEKVKAYENLSTAMPHLLNGRAKIDALIPDLATVYQDDIRKVIGQKDSSGQKTITDAELSNVRLAADINPELKGDQPGLVFGLKVTYDDGTTAVKPVTEMRSSHPEDSPRVIPIESAMKELTARMKLARLASTNPYYSKIFTPDYDKGLKALEKEKRTALLGIEKSYNKSLMELEKNALGGSASKESIAALNVQREASIERVNALYGVSPEQAHTKDNLQETIHQFIAEDPSRRQHFDEWHQWLDSNGRDLSQILNDKEDAGLQYSAFLAWKADKQARGNNELAVREAGERKGGVNRGLSDVSTLSPQVDLTQYQSKSNEALMSMTQDGDMNAWRVLIERQNAMRGGASVAPLPGKTTSEQRSIAKARMEEYQRLMKEGRTEEANKALTIGVL
ncbi:hypothetical protein C5F63_00520 [Photobacterium damselae subsp. damselae]|uniref:hypothetical protein n=1 Tax=Photobacterium damselae TaxID=38293 RepID=UPI000D076BC2|nr:hypothetical protein [Photobacterium damselae]PSB90819.1 hypothetical protein C5F63_00520 [Photobacterium damselae subsp. damselae]